MAGETTTETPTTTTTATVQLPSPPRLANDPAIDGPANASWSNELFRYLLSQQSTISQLAGTTEGETNPNNLPDPAATNLATAQQTANDAYTIAVQARTLAQKFRKAGTITISDAATTGALTLDPAEADVSYFASVTPSAKSGSPAAGSNLIESITKAVGSVTVTINTAPGAGTSRTFDVLVFRA